MAAAVDEYLAQTVHSRSHRTDLFHALKVKQAFGMRFVDDLKPQELETWIELRRNETSAATAGQTFGFLKRVCRQAVINGAASVDPTAAVSLYWALVTD